MTSDEESQEERLSALHVAAPTRVGGLETVLRGLALGLHRRNHRIGVVLSIEDSDPEPPLAEELRSEGVRVWTVRLSPRSYLEERRAVDRVIRSFKPDILHTHGYRPDILDGGLARKHGLGLVSTVHGSSRMGGLSHFFEWIQDYVLRRFDAVVAVSEALQDDLSSRGVPKDHIHVIRNGLYPGVDFVDRSEAREQLGLPDDAFVIGWIGRLIPAKGPDVFIDAVKRLESEGFVASIIGDGPLGASLREKAGKGPSGRVTFHGRVDNAARFFRAFDQFVISSRTEGTPLVLLEAMAAGVPVVCTPVGGVPEIIGPEAAHYVPPEDPAALAQALREVQAEPMAARHRAAVARKRVEERFSGNVWIPRYEQVYREISSAVA